MISQAMRKSQRLSATNVNVVANSNALKNAPHTAAAVAADDWPHAYSREQAAFPLPFVRAHKFWPSVGRIDNPYGDRNLMCSCPPIEAFEEAPLTVARRASA